MNPARPEEKQELRPQRSQSQDLPPVLRYGLAVVSIALALGAASFLRRFEIRNVEVPLFLFAVAVSSWLWKGRRRRGVARIGDHGV